MPQKYYELLFAKESLNWDLGTWLPEAKFRFPNDAERKASGRTYLAELYYAQEGFKILAAELETLDKTPKLFKRTLIELQIMNDSLIATVTDKAIELERLLLLFDREFLSLHKSEPEDFISELLEDDLSTAEVIQRLNNLYNAYVLIEVSKDELDGIFGAIKGFEVYYE